MSSKNHKQSVSELKLRRLTEHNSRLKEDLQRPRVRVSEASDRLVPLCPLLSSFIFFFCSLLCRFGLCIRTGGWTSAQRNNGDAGRELLRASGSA